MNTAPSIDQILEGVIIGLSTDIIPNVNNPKAYATAQMMQGLLQGVRQVLPVYDQRLAEEHNEMLIAVREVAAAIGDTPGDAADRIRERASRLGAGDDIPVPPSRAEVMAAHRQLSFALCDDMSDVDELQRAGLDGADDALAVIRAHFGPRVMRLTQTFLVGDALLGRG